MRGYVTPTIYIIENIQKWFVHQIKNQAKIEITEKKFGP